MYFYTSEVWLYNETTLISLGLTDYTNLRIVQQQVWWEFS